MDEKLQIMVTQPGASHGIFIVHLPFHPEEASSIFVWKIVIITELSDMAEDTYLELGTCTGSMSPVPQYQEAT